MTAEARSNEPTPIAATAADLLAHWWSRPVAAEVDGWVSWHEAAALVAGTWGGGPSTEVLCDPALPDAVAELLSEYERLFVGPGTVPCPPYESYWRDDVPVHLRRSLMGPCVGELRLLYGEMGLRMPEGAGELPDYVAAELEAVAYALSTDHAAVAGQLFRDHLGLWLPKLCRAVAREASLSFYRELAALTIAWLPSIGSDTGPEQAAPQ